MTTEDGQLEESYDRVAGPYADEYFDELERKPFDRELLDQFAACLRGQGRVCELGCGPGQISRYLQDRGVDMCGIDLSQKMVECAQQLNPDVSFQQGNMRALEIPDSSLAGIVCFYAIIHLKREQVVGAFREMHRVLRPDGRLLLSFHGGHGALHRDEWYDLTVSIDICLFERDEMAGYLEATGFEVERIVERSPYDFEYPTRRMYAFARKPANHQ